MLASAQVEAHLQQALANGGHFHLVVCSGRDLIARDVNLFSKRSSDPYVVVKAGGTRKVGKTKVMPKNLNPVWNQEFAFDISPKDKPMVVLELYDYDKGPRFDDAMGVVTLPLSMLISQEFHSIDKEFKVEQCKGAQEEKLGYLTIRATFDPIIPLAMKSGDVVPILDSKITVGLGWDVNGVKKQPKKNNKKKDEGSSTSSSSSRAELEHAEEGEEADRQGVAKDNKDKNKSNSSNTKNQTPAPNNSKSKSDKKSTMQPPPGAAPSVKKEVHGHHDESAHKSDKEDQVHNLPDNGPRKVSYVANKTIDLDASAVVFDKKGKLMEAIYFDQLISSHHVGKNSIVHFGDSQTGDEVQNGIDEKIQIDLNKLNPDVSSTHTCVIKYMCICNLFLCYVYFVSAFELLRNSNFFLCVRDNQGAGNIHMCVCIF
jgi:stress response protein SCP2